MDRAQHRCCKAVAKKMHLRLDTGSFLTACAMVDTAGEHNKQPQQLKPNDTTKSSSDLFDLFTWKLPQESDPALLFDPVSNGSRQYGSASGSGTAGNLSSSSFGEEVLMHSRPNRSLREVSWGRHAIIVESKGQGPPGQQDPQGTGADAEVTARKTAARNKRSSQSIPSSSSFYFLEKPWETADGGQPLLLPRRSWASPVTLNDFELESSEDLPGSAPEGPRELAPFKRGPLVIGSKHLTDDRRLWRARWPRYATIGDGKIISTGAARGMAARV